MGLHTRTDGVAGLPLLLVHLELQLIRTARRLLLAPRRRLADHFGLAQLCNQLLQGGVGLQAECIGL